MLDHLSNRLSFAGLREAETGRFLEVEVASCGFGGFAKQSDSCSTTPISIGIHIRKPVGVCSWMQLAAACMQHRPGATKHGRKIHCQQAFLMKLMTFCRLSAVLMLRSCCTTILDSPMRVELS